MINNEKKVHVTAIILAAGIGSRLGAALPKQKVELLGKSLLLRTVEAFYYCHDIDDIVIVTRDEDVDFANKELHFASKKIHSIISGGSSRAESAFIGFNNIPESTTHVAIHDGARCLIDCRDISSVVSSAIKYGAASAAEAVASTVKIIEAGMIKKTISRDNIMLAQTPQVFERSLYSKALENVHLLDAVTDDNMILENIGIDIKAVELAYENPKITFQKDLDYAEFLLKRRKIND